MPTREKEADPIAAIGRTRAWRALPYNTYNTPQVQDGFDSVISCDLKLT